MVTEVVWAVDRLARELAEARADVAQLSASSAGQGPARSVSDVDDDLEQLERERSHLETQKDHVQRKLERRKCATVIPRCL